jgi:hypothetical protein
LYSFVRCIHSNFVSITPPKGFVKYNIFVMIAICWNVWVVGWGIEPLA